MHGGGWTIAPVWLKDLHQLRPCLLYICIAQFHKTAGNYQWPGSSYRDCYNSVSFGSPSCLAASRWGWGLIGNHLVWLTRICSDQYLTPGPTWWEKTNQMFVYFKSVFTQALRIKYQNIRPSFGAMKDSSLIYPLCFAYEKLKIRDIVSQLENFSACFVSISCFLNHLLPLKSRTINKDNCIWIHALKWSTMQFH